MKPIRVGSPCWKVRTAVDEAMAEGQLRLPPELAAHASACPRCGPEVAGLQQVIDRLRAAAARTDLTRVPAVVDHVIAAVARESDLPEDSVQGVDWQFVITQIATVAAVVLVVFGGLTWAGLNLMESVSGVKAADMAVQVTAPFRDWLTAFFRSR
jgi:anti-sigma factor RsiW